MRGSQKHTNVRIVKSSGSIMKSETITQVSKDEAYNAGDWIIPPVDLRGLKRHVIGQMRL